jgi:hypothetical protein
VINPAPPAPPADEEEYPQANGCRCKADDQKDTSNSTRVVEERRSVARIVIGA